MFSNLSSKLLLLINKNTYYRVLLSFSDAINFFGNLISKLALFMAEDKAQTIYFSHPKMQEFTKKNYIKMQIKLMFR